MNNPERSRKQLPAPPDSRLPDLEDEASVLETPTHPGIPSPPVGPAAPASDNASPPPSEEPHRSASHKRRRRRTGRDGDAPQKLDGFSLSGLAIRRPIGTGMLALMILVLGGFYLTRLNVDLLPSITYPRIGVRLQAPGVSPEVAVEEITRPLEEALAATEGVVQVYSQTREGQVSVDLFFKPGGDIDRALNDATAALGRAQGNLPDTVEQPRLFKLDPSQLPVIEYALTSPQLSGKTLRVFADEELARELAVVPGVAAVDVSGGATEEIQVNVDLARLQASGVGLSQVLAALNAENQDVSGGRLEGGTTAEPLTRTVGRFQSPLEIENISFPVNPPALSGEALTAGAGQRPGRVYLRDFAKVIDGTEDQRVLVYLNRQPAVRVSIQKQPDANTVEVVDGIKARIAALRRSGVVPEGTNLVATTDESQFIRNSIKDVAISGAIGAALAAGAVLLFLGSLRQTLIIVLSIPLGSLFAVILMGVSGLSLNIFSLGGLAIGIGAVDSCIVVLENIVKAVEAKKGKQSSDSAPPSEDEKGEAISPSRLIPLSQEKSGELESALVASTTTNLAAVIPFLLIGGFVALLFNELILTVVFTVGAALLTSLTVVPMLASRLLSIRKSSGLQNFFLVRKFAQGFERISSGYGRLLEKALERRRRVLLIAFGLLGGLIVLLIPRIPTEILPRISTGQATLRAQFPPGTPLATSDRVMAEVDRIFREQPETEDVFTTVGGFLFGSATSENPLQSSSTVSLKPGTDVEAYVARVNRKFQDLGLVGIRLRLAPGAVRGLITSNSPVRGAEIDVILQGSDDATLVRTGRQVLATLDQKSKLAQFRPNADPTQPEIQVRRDSARAAELGLSTQQIGETIAAAIEGAIPTQLQRGERLIDVRVQLDQASIQSRAQLERLPLFVTGNRLIRLSDVASITEGQTPGEVQRINQRDVFILAGNLNEGVSLGDALKEVEAVLKDIKLPPGVTIQPSSAAQSSRELQSNILLLGSLAIFLVFIIMAVQYDSLVDPLVILFTIPLALSGGLIGLYLTGTAIGATVLIGVVLLIGVIVGNGIILVELANQIRDENSGKNGEPMERREAIAKAAPQRLRPITMTTMIAVLGLLPLALGVGEGTELLRPLGIVTLSGLLLGTLMTLFVVPCLYVTLHDIFHWNLLGDRKKGAAESDKPANEAHAQR